MVLPHQGRRDSLCVCPLLQVAQHQCIIHDALRGVKHAVQLRGKEDLETGQWSEWSAEATGTPWIGRYLGLCGGSLVCVSAYEFNMAGRAESASLHFISLRECFI